MVLSTILGGITGLVGNIVTGIVNYKTLKIKNQHDEKMVELETNAMKEEAKMNIAVTKAEIEGEVELADAQAYKESLKAGQKPMFSEKWIDKLFSVEGRVGKFLAIPAAIILAMAFGFVDWLRGFMRPALTIYLTGMTTVVTYMAWSIMNKLGIDSLSAGEAIALYSQVIDIVIYLTVTCVTWWFGDRRMAKFLTAINNKNEDKS
jgi:hypothetical protein